MWTAHPSAPVVSLLRVAATCVAWAPAASHSESSDGLQRFADAVCALEARESYEWRSRVEYDGAPIPSTEIAGSATASRDARLRVGSDEDFADFDVRAGRAAGHGDSTPDTDTTLPLDELRTLVPQLTFMTSRSDGSLLATVDSGPSNAAAERAIRSHAPMPGLKVSVSESSFQVWISDGLPIRYTITTTAAVELPIGQRKLRRTQSVDLAVGGPADDANELVRNRCRR